MSLRTIKYLVVQNVVEDVPDAAPEIDVEVSSLDDVAAALLRTTHLPASADIYLQTHRPDGSLRWQPLSSLSSLPDGLLLAKLVKPKGGVAGGPRPAAHPAPQQYPQQQQPQQQQHHSLIGKLLKKVVGGGGSGHTTHTTHYSSRPMGAGGMMMGGAGAGAAAGGFGRLGGGATDDVDAAWEQQVSEEMALAQLEEDALMQRDEDGDGVPDADADGDGVPDAVDDEDNRQDESQVEQEAYENFEAAAGDYADQQDGDNDDNAGGDDGGDYDNSADDDAGGFDEGGDDFGGGDDD